jgi:hypothetical protein
MAEDKKLILGVGDFYNIEAIGDYFDLRGEGRFSFGERAKDVTQAINEINSNKYWGVVMSSLVLSTGEDADKYNFAAKKFSQFDSPPMIWRSGGLYVVEQSCKKGLITLVNAIAEEPADLMEATRLGAKCFSGISHIAEQNLKYFQSKL